MATYNFRRYGFGILVCLGGVLVANSSVEAIELGLKNDVGKAWVHRRAKGDDAGGAYAIVLRIDPNLTSHGRLWYFPKMNAAGTKYIESSKPILVNATVKPNEGGEGDRRREKITLTDLSGQEVAYVTLYQGRAIKKANLGQERKARDSQRLIFRWNAAYPKIKKEGVQETPAPQRDASPLDDCDGPPDDAPMEEETAPPSQPDETLADMLVDP